MPRPRKYDDANNNVHEVSDDKLSIVDGKIVKTTSTGNPQREALKKYEEKFEKIVVRLPKGSRERINNYVNQSDKYGSVNAMIIDLIEKELKEKLN